MNKSFSKTLILLFITWFMFGFSSVSYGDVEKVGVLLHLSGDWAEFGKVQKNSLKIALEDMQNNWGEGRTLELIIHDTSHSPEKVRSSVEELITKDKVSFIIAGTTRKPTWEAASVAEAHKVPFLIAGNVVDELTEQGWKYVFRLNPPLSEYWNGFLWFMTEVVKPRTIAFFGAKGFAGELRSSVMINHCQKAGYEIVFDYFYEKDTIDFRPELGLVKKINPDVIAVASYLDDSVHFIQQCKELDINPLLFVGLGGFSLPEFGDLAGELANYVFAVSWWDPSVPYPGSKEYSEKYEKRYHLQPDFLGAETYAALQVLRDVISRAGSTDSEGLRKAMLSADMETIIGPVKFVSYGKKTQQNRLPTYLVQWIKGEMKVVWPPRLASQKYIYPFPGWEKQ